MDHPIPAYTQIEVAIPSCQTCGPQHLQKFVTRIVESELIDGEHVYTILDGRKVTPKDILQII